MRTQITGQTLADLTHMLSLDDLRRFILENENKQIEREDRRMQYLELREDGSVYLGPTKYKWFNRWFKDEKIIRLTELVMQIIEFLAGTVKSTRNKELIQRVLHQYAQMRIDKGNMDEIVDMLFALVRFGIQNDVLESSDVKTLEEFLSGKTKVQKKIQEEVIIKHINVDTQAVLVNDGFNRPQFVELPKTLR